MEASRRGRREGRSGHSVLGVPEAEGRGVCGGGGQKGGRGAGAGAAAAAAGTWVAIATRAVLVLVALRRRRHGSGARLGSTAAARWAIPSFRLADAPRPPLHRLAEPRVPEVARAQRTLRASARGRDGTRHARLAAAGRLAREAILARLVLEPTLLLARVPPLLLLPVLLLVLLLALTIAVGRPAWPAELQTAAVAVDVRPSGVACKVGAACRALLRALGRLSANRARVRVGILCLLGRHADALAVAPAQTSLALHPHAVEGQVVVVAVALRAAEAGLLCIQGARFA